MVSCSGTRTGSPIAIPSTFDIKSTNHFIKHVWLLYFSSAGGARGNERFLDISPPAWGWMGWGLEQMVAGLADHWLACSPGLGSVSPGNPLQSPTGFCFLRHHPLPLAKDLKTQVPESGIPDTTWPKQAASYRQHCSGYHHGWGEWRPPTLLDPCRIYVPTTCPVPLRGGPAPQWSAPCLSTLSLLISRPT